MTSDPIPNLSEGERAAMEHACGVGNHELTIARQEGWRAARDYYSEHPQSLGDWIGKAEREAARAQAAERERDHHHLAADQLGTELAVEQARAEAAEDKVKRALGEVREAMRQIDRTNRVLFIDGERVALPEVCDLSDDRYVVMTPVEPLRTMLEAARDYLSATDRKGVDDE